jgi:hypothetical protein
VIDIVEVLVRWHAGRKKSGVARTLGVERGTVHKYVAHAESEGYVPGDRVVTVESSSGEHWRGDSSPSWSTRGGEVAPTTRSRCTVT